MSQTSKSNRFTRASAYLITISAVILVGTEVIAIAAATAWALGGLLQLGAVLTWALGVLLCMAAAWVSWVFALNAWAVEKEAGSDHMVASRVQKARDA